MTKRMTGATVGRGRPTVNSVVDVSFAWTQGPAAKLTSALQSSPHRKWWDHFIEKVFKKSKDIGSIPDPCIQSLWARFCIRHEEVSLSKTPNPETAPEAVFSVRTTTCWLLVNRSVKEWKQTGNVRRSRCSKITRKAPYKHSPSSRFLTKNHGFHHCQHSCGTAKHPRTLNHPEAGMTPEPASSCCCWLKPLVYLVFMLLWGLWHHCWCSCTRSLYYTLLHQPNFKLVPPDVKFYSNTTYADSNV